MLAKLMELLSQGLLYVMARTTAAFFLYRMSLFQFLSAFLLFSSLSLLATILYLRSSFLVVLSYLLCIFYLHLSFRYILLLYSCVDLKDNNKPHHNVIQTESKTLRGKNKLYSKIIEDFINKFIF